MNVYTLCDPAIWDQAQWFGAMFAHDQSGNGPPLMGLMFRDVEAGKEVFRSFRRHVGINDKAGLIRISIVEGDIPGEKPGYSVVVGWDPDKAVQAERARGDSGSRSVAFVTRHHRMNPAPGSSFLPRFKEGFDKHRQFVFMPTAGTPARPEPLFELGIEKYAVTFKRAESITRQDFEHAIINDGDWISPDVNPRGFLR